MEGALKAVFEQNAIDSIQELCESWGGRPGLSVLMSLTVSVDVKQHWTMLTHWSQFVPNMSTWHPRTLSSTSSLWKLWESCGRRWRRSCHTRWPAIVPNNMSWLGLSTRWLCRWDVSHLVSRGGIDDEMRSSLTLQQEWQTETPMRQVQIYKHSQVMKVCRLWPRSDLAQRPWSWNWKWYYTGQWSKFIMNFSFFLFSLFA